MKKNNSQILLAVFVFFLSSFNGNIKGQVTIGSNIKPNSGALLDLKENDNINENSTKGLGLPRVNLTKWNSLDDLAGGLNKSEHIGLVVYHAGAVDLCAKEPFYNGVYVWTGSEWKYVSSTNNEEEALANITTSKIGLAQPNTYMVNQAATVKIPVEKAFVVWDGSSWKDENGNALLDAKNFIGKKMSASLLWQDDRCEDKPIKSVSISNSNSDPSAYIEVKVARGYGNGVVALHIGDNGDSTDEIVWSWHIWATPPMTETTYNGLVWMDRNLGATTTDSNDGRSNGNYYQWGRKDPFYGSHSWDSGTPAVVTDIDENLVHMSFSDVIGTNRKVNLSNSITKPFTYIASSSINDWYSNTGFLWQIRWGADGNKSASDPCPEGWKVPIGTGGTGVYHAVSPWNGISMSDLTAVGNYGKMHAALGFFPLSGHRTYSGGNMSNMQTEGSLWSGSPAASNNYPLIRYFSLYNSSVDTWLTRYDSKYGFPVRCVRE